MNVMYITNMGREHENIFVRIAHRGASAYEPENTLRSFKRAIEMNSELIEFDVRESLDGELVVMHDDCVDRTTNGSGIVKRKTLSELKELDAGMGEQIPTLVEVLEFGTGKTKFVIELKEDGIEEKVIRVLHEYGIGDDVFIVSFKGKRLKMIKQIDPDIKTGLILFGAVNPIKQALKYGADAVAPFRWFITRAFIQAARSHGLYAFSWVVDDSIKARKLKNLGIDGIVTNKPDII